MAVCFHVSMLRASLRTLFFNNIAECLYSLFRFHCSVCRSVLQCVGRRELITYIYPARVLRALWFVARMWMFHGYLYAWLMSPDSPSWNGMEWTNRKSRMRNELVPFKITIRRREGYRKLKWSASWRGFCLSSMRWRRISRNHPIEGILSKIHWLQTLDRRRIP